MTHCGSQLHFAQCSSWKKASACASSFSWWGKARSAPPVWMSICGPMMLLAIAEHSMCQPARRQLHISATRLPKMAGDITRNWQRRNGQKQASAPGLPLPRLPCLSRAHSGESQAGSPALACFHSAKSLRFFLSLLAKLASPSAAAAELIACGASLPYVCPFSLH